MEVSFAEYKKENMNEPFQNKYCLDTTNTISLIVSENSEHNTCQKHCGSCYKIGEVIQNVWNIPFKLKKFFFTGIVMTTADVATDFYQAFKHFQ